MHCNGGILFTTFTEKIRKDRNLNPVSCYAFRLEWNSNICENDIHL